MSEKNMNFGLFFLNSVAPWKTDAEELRDGLEQIREADELGFDTAWIAEHNARKYGVVSSTAVYMAAAAAQTKRIMLGSAVTRLPLHHPLQVAEDMNLVDVISDGRLYVGVGKGYDAYEFEAYNIDFEQRHDKYEESLDIIKAAFQNERVSYSGKFYNIQDVPVYPRPVQKQGPPIFVMVSGNDASIVKAAKEGHSFVLGGITNEDTMHKISLYRKTALEAGYSQEYVEKAISRSGKLLFFNVAETTEQAAKEYEKGLMWYMSVRDNRPTFGVVDRDRHLNYDDFLKSGNAFIGSSEKTINDIKKFREETGLNNIICWFNCGGQPQQQVLKAMQLFSKEVMPHFKGSYSISHSK
ncbi:hypothetical protein DCC39_14280 [Pueribacillus theae]|uniref:Luciferase-like domain-containing protein n=1 Tax=Pueribacillus theae TaxID=2171751 RepID=A0A2U1JU98_9BACI|nr:LLM class flavin-dependent oxidoreductase [Pueribacillus theae]PWA08771.1 hypothetical protein DCC39_14280 [Pueribacillus theae]